jgi:hypothetical protein
VTVDAAACSARLLLCSAAGSVRPCHAASPCLFRFVGGAAYGRTHSGSRQRRVGERDHTDVYYYVLQPLRNGPVHISMPVFRWWNWEEKLE